MKKNIILFTILMLLFSNCSKNRKDLSLTDEKIKIENLEYTVYNQTLSLLGENILYNRFNHNYPKKIELELFNERFDIRDKTKLFERLIKEDIDTAKVSLSKIDFLIVPDSLDAKDNLIKKEFKINKLNHPKEIILIKKNDNIRELNVYIKSISLSRILFDETKNKAEFEIGIMKGKMNGKGIKVKCELKNGAWVIVDTKTIWLS